MQLAGGGREWLCAQYSCLWYFQVSCRYRWAEVLTDFQAGAYDNYRARFLHAREPMLEYCAELLKERAGTRGAQGLA